MGYSTTNLISVGLANNSVGTIDTISNQRKGIRLYSPTPVFLEYFNIYPSQSGVAFIKLYHANTNKLIASISQLVNVNPNGEKIWLRTFLQGNTNYDLIADSLSVPVTFNSSGFTYPISSPTSPLTITGYIDSVFHTTSDYYNYFNINTTNGCRSDKITVYGYFHPPLNISIQNIGPLTFCQGDSVKLQAGSGGLSSYAWLKNGILNGATGYTYTAKSAGIYQVITQNAYCIDTSSGVPVRVPCIQTFDPQEKIDTQDTISPCPQFSIYYSSGTGELYLDAVLKEEELYTLIIIDQTGKELSRENLNFSRGKNSYSINVQNISAGLYIMKLQSEKNRFVERWLKY